MTIESQPAPSASTEPSAESASHVHGSRTDAADLPAALAAMARAGLRRMPSRVLILEQLARAEGHLSAAEIHRNRAPEYAQVHLGTVHRGLETLQRAGLVHVIDDHGRQLFGLSLPPHLHAVC